jgi:hypothetical protein
MNRKRTHPVFGLLLAFAMAGSMWFYFQRVLVPYQQADAAAHGRPRGNLSDLYPRWWGAHELLLHGRNPYSAEITQEIQQGYYGRVLDPSRPGDPTDAQGVAYPVYVVFLLAPTIDWPFHAVQRGFLWLLWILTAASVPLWLRALRWKLPGWQIIGLVVLVLGSLPAVQGIKLQQLTVVVALMMAACMAAVVSGWFLVAGCLLALSTIKPQLVWLPGLWLALWSLRGWRRRQRLAWGFLFTMLALMAGAEWVSPGWLWRFRTAVVAYHRYTHNVSVLGWLLTPMGGDIAVVALLLLLSWLCWPFLLQDENSLGFSASLGAVFAFAVVAVPMFAPYNQLLLLPSLLVLWRSHAIWKSKRSTRLIAGIASVLLFWPWIATLALVLASFVLRPQLVESWWKAPFLASLVLPIFIFVLAALWMVQLRVNPRTADADRSSSPGIA